MISIRELKRDKLDEFIQYLNVHVSENGQNDSTPFLPLSNEQSLSGADWLEKFESGISEEIEEIGWRRVWIASSADNKIVGHVDIRSHFQLNTNHRVLLGLGVDSKFRNLKIGRNLMEFIIDYCKQDLRIAWIDLQVMTNNEAAIKLYKKMNFKELSTVTDMFRINQISYDYSFMTLNVDN